MRRLYFFLLVVLVCSCASMPNGKAQTGAGTAPETPDNLARVRFANLSSEDVYLRLRRGNAEQNIGAINLDGYGRLQRTTSLIPSRQSRDYIIPADYYTIVLKKDENGRVNTEGNSYEEFFFPASMEPYEINLFPTHDRTTSVTITSPGVTDNKKLSLDASFDIYFSEDMIQPIVEKNIDLLDENRKPITFGMEWRDKRRLTLKPKELLLPSATYTVIVQLEARNMETDRIRETGEALFTTGDAIEFVSSFDPASIRFDTSVPGWIRLDWDLPPGADGSEMRTKSGESIDLQAKTTHSFSSAETDIAYKIVPYRLINGRKAYNQAALDAPFRSVSDDAKRDRLAKEKEAADAENRQTASSNSQPGVGQKIGTGALNILFGLGSYLDGDIWGGLTITSGYALAAGLFIVEATALDWDSPAVGVPATIGVAAAGLTLVYGFIRPFIHRRSPNVAAITDNIRPSIVLKTTGLQMSYTITF